MSNKMKDFFERLFWTVALAAISFGIVYLTDSPEVWALGVLAVLQSVKNMVAQQVGDPSTGSFTGPVSLSPAVGDPDGLEPVWDDEVDEAAKFDA